MNTQESQERGFEEKVRKKGWAAPQYLHGCIYISLLFSTTNCR